MEIVIIVLVAVVLLGSVVGFTTERREITSELVGVGLVLLITAAGLSLVWSQRLP